MSNVSSEVSSDGIWCLMSSQDLCRFLPNEIKNVSSGTVEDRRERLYVRDNL